MADKSLDELYIEIEAKSEKAESKIDNLIKDLTKLRSALNGINDTGLSKLLNKLDSLKSNSLNRLANSVKSLSNSDLDKFSKNLGTVRSELDKFGNSGDGISNAGKGLNNLSKGAERLSSINIETTVGALKSIYNEISKFDTLSAKLANVASGLNGVGSAAKTAASAANSIPSQRVGSPLPTRTSAPTGKVNSGGFAATNAEVKKTTKQMSRLKSALSSVQKIGSKAGKAIVNGFKKVPSAISKVHNGLKKLRSSLKSTGKSGRSMGQFLKEAFRGTLVYGGMFMALSTVMNSVTEGIQNMALGSERFNKTMSSLTTSMLYMRNSLTTAIAPALNALAPIIERIADGFANAAEKVGMFFASLLGQNVFTEAIKTDVDYAESLNKTESSASSATDAIKELKKTLSGFDELNLIKTKTDDTTTSTSGKYETPTGNFQDVNIDSSVSKFADKIKDAWEKADFGELGSTVANKISDALSNINWDSVISTGYKIGRSLATFINGALAYTDEDGQNLAQNIGETLSNAFNTVLYSVKGFVSKLNWKSVGKSLADGILSFIKNTDWKVAGEDVHDLVTGICDAIGTFFDELTSDEEESQAVSNAIKDFIEGLDIPDIAISLVKVTISAFKFVGITAADLISQFVADILGGTWDGTYVNLFPSSPLSIKVPSIKLDWFKSDGTKDSGSFKEKIEKFFKDLGDLPMVTMSLGGSSGDSNGSIFGNMVTDCQTAISKIKSKFSELSSWLSEKKTDFQTKGSELISGLSEGIGNIWEKIVEKFNTFRSNITSWFSNLKTNFIENGSQLITNLSSGIGDVWSKIRTKFDTFKTNVTNWFKERVTDFKRFGSDLINNIAAGIGDIWSKVSQKFTDFKNKLKSFFSGLDIFNIKVSYEPTTILGKTVNLPKLSFKASGGYVNSGEAFIARENGMPEMVGRIGNRTAVANNDQIVQAVSAGVFNAVVSAMGTLSGGRNTDSSIPIVINLNGEPIYKDVINRHNNEVIMGGISPLIVGT